MTLFTSSFRVQANFHALWGSCVILRITLGLIRHPGQYNRRTSSYHQPPFSLRWTAIALCWCSIAAAVGVPPASLVNATL
jgi:hypothetical protein